MMDSSKAKKAVDKAMMAKAVLAAAAAINPEIQAMSPALQPMDGYVNPMARMGTVPPVFP